MAHPIFLVDAFTWGPFTGNPAGVCPLKDQAGEVWMQQVAGEMNQAETAFVWPSGGAYGLRWFTPTVEVDLCGHATLATAHVLWDTGIVPSDADCEFDTRSGRLSCQKDGGEIKMVFPNECPSKIEPSGRLKELFGETAVWFGENRMDWFVEVLSEEALLALEPSMAEVFALGKRGLLVTAKANRQGADYVSRFFAPQSGVPEDHVTGSAHCALGPYWSDKLGRADLTGFQCSRRGGVVGTTVQGDKVVLKGKASTVLKGELL
ncbi:MAG: PhzF family phenazine biosynthesis protein [Armatimonadetes bacterium]|nr:PhzF family phenazine biosynthesis protein [Armatimonadota bacterium]